MRAAVVGALVFIGCAPAGVIPPRDGMDTWGSDALCEAAADAPQYFREDARLYIIDELERREAIAPNAAAAAREKKIYVGMTKCSLLASWGRPTTINRSSYGPAQWVYRTRRDTQYVYVNERTGMVKAWSD